MQRYADDEMDLIFRDYVENDGVRWMNFVWDMVPEHLFITPRAHKIWRGGKNLGPDFNCPLSNGTTSKRTAKEFAWDYFLNRNLSQKGRRVALYRLASYSRMICLSKIFGRSRSFREGEVIICDAVWERAEHWVLEDPLAVC